LISTERHKETTQKGEPLFIVRTLFKQYEGNKEVYKTLNEGFDRKRLNVKFWNGVGKTIHPEKARYFSEILNYEVVLHESMPDDILGFAAAKPRAELQTFEEEDQHEIDSGEYEEED